MFGVRRAFIILLAFVLGGLVNKWSNNLFISIGFIGGLMWFFEYSESKYEYKNNA